MRKHLKTVLTTVIISAISCMTVFAGQWQSNSDGWWYDNGNGTWPASSWQWIDGDNDGVAECYYFDQNGYCVMNGVAPDGYSVNEVGAWVVDGAVQKKNIVSTGNGTINNQTQSTPQVDKENQKEVDLFAMTPLSKSVFHEIDRAQPTAGGSIWTDGYIIVNAGYVLYDLGGQYDTLEMDIVLGSLSTTPSSQTYTNSEYNLVFMGDDDNELASYNLLNQRKTKHIEVDVSGQQQLLIRWGSDKICNHIALMKNGVLH